MTPHAADSRLRKATVLLPRYLCLTIAVAGFALSANALTAVAADSQAVTPEMAWLVVVVVDGLLLAASAVGWARALDGERAWPAIITVAVTGAVSTAINVAHADGGLLAQGIAAIPPIALLTSLELVMAELRRSLTADTKADTKADTQADTRADIEGGRGRGRGRGRKAVAGLDGRGRADMAAAIGRPSAVTQVPAPPSGSAGMAGEFDRGLTAVKGDVAAVKPVDRPRSRPTARKAPLGQVVELVAAHEADGGHVTDPELTVAVAAALRVSERTARRRLEPFRAGKVAPLAAAADSVGGAA